MPWLALETCRFGTLPDSPDEHLADPYLGGMDRRTLAAGCSADVQDMGCRNISIRALSVLIQLQ